MARLKHDGSGTGVNWTWLYRSNATSAILRAVMSSLDIAVSIALGIGLATAVGFPRVPATACTSVAAYTGHLQLSDGFAWLGSLPAMTMLGVAALAEVAAYYIPAVDNLLDTITTPAALVAGTLVSAAVMTDLPPIVKWTTAIIAGGGAAGLTQGVPRCCVPSRHS